MTGETPSQLSAQRRPRTIRTRQLCAVLLLGGSFASTCHGQLDLIVDFSCDARSDTCSSQFNGVCDDKTSCREGTDCFDCDECQAYMYDCQGCLQRGCYWCPGDATCFNSDRYVSQSRLSSCTSRDDYISAQAFEKRDITFDELCQLAPSADDIPNFTSDPLYSAQKWVFDAIQVQEAWRKGYTGQGVRVRINDNGMDVDHAEFAGRFELDASCENNYLPTVYPNVGEELDHGTIVAGIVGAAANNGVCSVGIAPQVTLSSCDIFARASSGSKANERPTFFLDPGQNDMYDISQNSFGDVPCLPLPFIGRKLAFEKVGNGRQRNLQGGNSCPFEDVSNGRVPFPCDVCSKRELESLQTAASISSVCKSSIIRHCQWNYEEDRLGCMEVLDLLVTGGKCKYQSLTNSARDALNRGIQNGRDGKGIIFVWAAGNDHEIGVDTNTMSFLTSRFVIGVGATGKDNLHASYSNTGANLMVVAPGGDQETVSNHVTATVGGNSCGGERKGTSFSCPVVSGVIALMLEANPSLAWRDVQEILASTSSPIANDPNDDSAGFNAAGYWHSNDYGFGLIQAGAAVATAETWTLLPPERQLFAESGNLFLPIKDDGVTVTQHSMMVDGGKEPFVTESVAILLQVEHFSRGHLEIVLTSPQGTRSVLHPGKFPENTQLDLDGGASWKFLTRKTWGESPNGSWKLEIVDTKLGDVEDNCINSDWLIFESSIGEVLSCQNFEELRLCADGELDPLNQIVPEFREFLSKEYRDNGLLVTEACCACGGQGLTRKDVTDQLVQWTLIVYGRQDSRETVNAPPTSPPSSAPTPAPSFSPTAPPTLNPTISPTVRPTLAPTRITTASTSAPISNSSSIDPVPADQDLGPLPTETPGDGEGSSLRNTIGGFFSSAAPTFRPIQSFTLMVAFGCLLIV